MNATLNRHAVEIVGTVHNQTGRGKKSIIATEAVQHGFRPPAALPRGQLKRCSTVVNPSEVRGSVKIAGGIQDCRSPSGSAPLPAVEIVHDSFRPATAL